MGLNGMAHEGSWRMKEVKTRILAFEGMPKLGASVSQAVERLLFGRRAATCAPKYLHNSNNGFIAHPYDSASLFISRLHFIRDSEVLPTRVGHRNRRLLEGISETWERSMFDEGGAFGGICGLYQGGEL